MSNVTVQGTSTAPVPVSIQTASAITTAAVTATSPIATTAGVKLLVNGNGNASPGGSNAFGAIVKKLKVTALATTAAVVHSLYRSPDNGVTLYLVNSVLMGAATVASPATATFPVVDFGYSEALVEWLEAGDSLYVASSQALTAGYVWDVCYEAY